MCLLLFTLHCPVQTCQTKVTDYPFLTAQTCVSLPPPRGPTSPAPSHRNPKVSSVSSYSRLFILPDFPPRLAALTLHSIIWQTRIEFPPCAQPRASPVPGSQPTVMGEKGCWSSGTQRLMNKQVNKQLQSTRYTLCQSETEGGTLVSPLRLLGYFFRLVVLRVLLTTALLFLPTALLWPALCKPVLP